MHVNDLKFKVMSMRINYYGIYEIEAPPQK